jgi:radical SAM protein with 4Fe4S-binding SPASM domain
MKRIREYGRIPLETVLPLSTPFVINVDPSSVCNLRCTFCFQSASKMKPTGIMSWDTYKVIIKDIKEFNTKIKTLRLYAFGEPLLNPRLPDMIKLAKDSDICEDIDMTTNGTLFFPQLSKDIIDAGIDRINISVNGINSEQYKKFSQREVDFDEYVEEISYLHTISKDCIIFTKINGDTTSKSDQQKFLDIFTPISDGCAIEHVMNCWYDFNMKDITPNKELGVYGQPLTHVDVCPYIFYSFCIQYDGVVSACFLDWNRQLVIGNVHKSSLLDIWEGDPLKDLKTLMVTKKRKTHPICSRCNQLEAGQPVNIDHLAKNLLRKLQ